MNDQNREGFSSEHDYSSQHGSQMGNPLGNENQNNPYSEGIQSGEHNYQQDETQYGRIRENETGFQKAERNKDLPGEGGSKVENAERKLDKAEKKVEKAEEKYAKGYENDAERKLDKAEKKVEKAKDKLEDIPDRIDAGFDKAEGKITNEAERMKSKIDSTFHRNEGKGSSYSSTGSSMGQSNLTNDNAQDYENQIKGENDSWSEHVRYGQNTDNASEYDQNGPATQH